MSSKTSVAVTDRLYYGFRQMIAEYLRDKTVGHDDADIDGKAGRYSVGKASRNIYSFREEEMAAYLAKRLRGYSAELCTMINYVSVKTCSGTVLLNIKDINFIRRENGRTVYHMSDKRTLAGLTLRTSFVTDIKKHPELDDFIFAGVSRAVNPGRVESFHRNMIRFDNGDREFLSDRLYFKAKKEYDLYMKEKSGY